MNQRVILDKERFDTLWAKGCEHNKNRPYNRFQSNDYIQIAIHKDGTMELANAPFKKDSIAVTIVAHHDRDLAESYDSAQMWLDEELGTAILYWIEKYRAFKMRMEALAPLAPEPKIETGSSIEVLFQWQADSRKWNQEKYERNDLNQELNGIIKEISECLGDAPNGAEIVHEDLIFRRDGMSPKWDIYTKKEAANERSKFGIF